MTHKLLATSLITACLTTTSLISINAMANDNDLYFYPKDRWVVERINNGDERERLHTCALSNQLNNGYIVQLAGTSNGFTNLNIDFRQNSFNENQKYEVKYSVPGIIEKVIPTKAFKQNLLVSDLRHNAEFAKALNTTSVLDVQIRDNKFRMYMTGLEATLEEYTQCITPATTMASTEAVATPKPIFENPAKAPSGGIAPPPPVPPMNTASVNSDKNAAQNTQEMPAHKLRPSPSKKPRYTEELAKQLKEQSEQYKPSEPEALVDHNKETDPVVASGSKTTEKSKSPKPVYKVTKMDSISVDLTDAAQQKNNAAKEADIQAIKVSSIEAPEINIQNIEPASGVANEEYLILRNKVSEMEARIGTLLNKNKLLDEELKSTLLDAKSEQRSVSSDNWNLERATLKFNESERQALRLGRQLQTQKAQCQKEKSELESMLFDPKLTNQQQLASLAALENDLDTAKSTFYRQQRQYEERIRLLEQQLNAQAH
ncbi:MAG: hypothetical protein ACRBB3_07615 [Alphaproteobacteria bacterium]